jgi:hypothetical protein
MDFNINDVVAKYIELRDSQNEEAKAFSETMKAKYTEPMEIIEKILLREMERMGVDSLKTPSGTPYKAVTKSVKMTDPEQFKRFVFAPLIDSLTSALSMDREQVYSLLTSSVYWDMIDVRAGKKGITSYVDDNGVVPPGIALDQFTTINIRRA